MARDIGHVWVIQHSDDASGEPRHVVNHEHEAHSMCQSMTGTTLCERSGNSYVYEPKDQPVVKMTMMGREDVLRKWPDVILPVAD